MKCDRCGMVIEDDNMFDDLKHFSRIEGFKRKDYCEKCWVEM